LPISWSRNYVYKVADAGSVSLFRLKDNESEREEDQPIRKSLPLGRLTGYFFLPDFRLEDGDRG
jgi:hypothetical protein